MSYLFIDYGRTVHTHLVLFSPSYFFLFNHDMSHYSSNSAYQSILFSAAKLLLTPSFTIIKRNLKSQKTLDGEERDPTKRCIRHFSFGS